MLRVRELLNLISYKALTDEGAIPKFEAKAPSVEYPFQLKGSQFSIVGLFVEYALKCYLAKIAATDDLGDDTIEMFGGLISDPDDLDALYTAYCNCNIKHKKLTRKQFGDFSHTFSNAKKCARSLLKIGGCESPFVFGAEIMCGTIVGHPDILLPNGTPAEVKCHKEFIRTYRQQSYMQIATYSAMLNSNSGILVLPLQKKIIRINFSSWDGRAFIQRMDQNIIFYLRFTLSRGRIGSHISIANGLNEAINIGMIRTTQIYMPKTVTNKEMDAIRSLEKEVFCHAPNSLNLSGATTARTDVLQQDIERSVCMGFKGVVVHVGKSCKTSTERALLLMLENIRKMLNFATIKCPLLLETPAGQGTELLTTYEQFSHFYSEVDDLRFGVCIDTCHVFASGHSPRSYIESWIGDHGAQSLKLVHFNDSMFPKGCKLDRHAPIGLGYIPKDELSEIMRLCSEHNIPMVVE